VADTIRLPSFWEVLEHLEALKVKVDDLHDAHEAQLDVNEAFMELSNTQGELIDMILQDIEKVSKTKRAKRKYG